MAGAHNRVYSVPKIDVFKALVSHDTNSTAIIHPDGARFSYGNLVADSARYASHLLSISQKENLNGGRVCFMISNSYEFTVTMLATWAAGGTAVPLCVSHPTKELAYVLNDSRSEIAISSAAYEEKLRDAIGQVDDSAGIHHERIDELKPSTEEQPSLEPVSNANRTSLFIYTSGTTGDPKGCVHTHQSLAAQSKSLISAWKYSTSDRLLHVLPLHHIHGLVNGLITPLFAGSAVEFAFPFNVSNTWKRLSSGEITFFTAVPTIYSRLNSEYEKLDSDAQAKASKGAQELRVAISGSAALPHSIANAWQNISKTPLLERYGMSETGMIVSNGLDVNDRIDGSVGRPLPGVKLRLVDADQKPVPSGQAGEIQVGGELLFREYWGKPEATRKEFTDDGWFKTGDVAVEKDGRIFIQGRASVDIIKSGGEKISALEVEREILSLNEIQECAVVGIEDQEWGQRVAAVVILAPGVKKFSRLDLRKALAGKLANYKIPMTMKAVETIPRNQMGKINKKSLVKEMF